MGKTAFSFHKKISVQLREKTRVIRRFALICHYQSPETVVIGEMLFTSVESHYTTTGKIMNNKCKLN